MFRASNRSMLLQDIRFGLRTALKNKGVTALAVTCLGIGVGLNTMMFSVTDGVLVQPLPYQDPDTIVTLNTTQKQNGIERGSLSWLRSFQSCRSSHERDPRSMPFCFCVVFRLTMVSGSW